MHKRSKWPRKIPRKLGKQHKGEACPRPLFVEWLGDLRNYNAIILLFWFSCPKFVRHFTDQKNKGAVFQPKSEHPWRPEKWPHSCVKVLRKLGQVQGKADPCPREPDTAIRRPPPRSHNLRSWCFCYLLFSLLFIFLLRPPAFKELVRHPQKLAT